MTINEIRRRFPNHSESFLRLNAGPSLGAVAPNIPRQTALRTLDKGAKEPASRQRRVGIVVTLVAHRKRLLDGHDNNAYSMKSIVDAIADTFGRPDKDPIFTWQYAQVVSRGPEGVAVSIVQR